MITIKDIQEFLSSFPPDTPVELDKDGWLEDEIPHDDVQQLIRKRGIFSKIDESNFGGSLILFINN